MLQTMGCELVINSRLYAFRKCKTALQYESRTVRKAAGNLINYEESIVIARLVAENREGSHGVAHHLRHQRRLQILELDRIRRISKVWANVCH